LTKNDQNHFTLTETRKTGLLLATNTAAVSFALSAQNKAQHRYETIGKCQLHR